MIERFTKDKHYELIERWFLARKRGVPRDLSLPDTGFVANGIAIGFLITTNCSVARFENIIVDKTASAAERSAALKLLFEALEEEAEAKGFFAVEMLCDGDAMSNRLSDLGFLRFGEYELFFKEVRKCRG